MMKTTAKMGGEYLSPQIQIIELSLEAVCLAGSGSTDITPTPSIPEGITTESLKQVKI